jgi:hypothetical protein
MGMDVARSMAVTNEDDHLFGKCMDTLEANCSKLNSRKQPARVPINHVAWTRYLFGADQRR